MLPATALILRSIMNFRNIRKLSSTFVSTNEIEVVKIIWLWNNQQELVSSSTFNNLENSLRFIQDNKGLYCSTEGLSQKKPLAYNVQEPVLLKRNYGLTRLLVIDVHNRVRHSDERHASAKVRNEYWVPKVLVSDVSAGTFGNGLINLFREEALLKLYCQIMVFHSLLIPQNNSLVIRTFREC